MPTAVPRRVLAAVVALSLGVAGAFVALPAVAVPSVDPVPVAPVAGAVLGTTAPVFTWTPGRSDLPATLRSRVEVRNAADTIVRFGLGQFGSTWSPRVPMRDGDYTWRVRGVDRLASEGPWSTAIPFTIDTVAPRLTLTSPALGLFGGGGVSIAGTIVEDHPGTLEIHVDGAVVFSGPAAAEFSHTVFPSSGTHTITVVAVDVAGNSDAGSRASVVIDVDAEGPHVAIAVPVDGSFVRPGAGQRFLASVEPTRTRADIVMAVDGTPIHEASTTSTRSYNRPVATDGWVDGAPHTFTVTATDQLGQSNSLSVTVTVDAVSPEVAIDTPRRNEVLSGVVDVTGSARDARSGVASLELRVRPYDGATATCGDPIDAVAVAADGDGVWSSVLDTTSLADGAYCLLARALDAAGNAGADQVRFVTVDNSAPAGSLTPVFPQGFTLTADRLEWSAVTDAHAFEYEVVLGDHPNVDADGIMTSGLVHLGATTSTTLAFDHPTGPGFWQVRAVDELGNATPWTAPTGFQVIGVPTVLAPATGLVFSDPSLTVEWAPSFGVLGVARYEIRYGLDRDHDGVLEDEIATTSGHTGWPIAEQSTTLPFPGDGAVPSGYEGPISVSVRAIYHHPFGGSIEGPWSAPTVSTVRDVAAPTVRIDAPGDGAHLRGDSPVSATVSATDAGGITSLALELFASDGVTPVATLGRETGTLGATTVRTWEVPAALPPGDYVLRATAVDIAAVETTASSSFTIDRRRPTVTIETRSAGATFAGDVALTVTGVDAGGLDRVVANLFAGTNAPPRLLRIGAVAAAGESTATATWVIRHADFPGDGVYTIRARAVDLAGNGRTTTMRIVIDTTGPAAPQPVGPPNGVTQANDSLVLEWAPVADAASYQVRTSRSSDRTPDVENGELSAADAVTVSASGTELALTALAQGALWWQVRGMDALGNVGPWSTIWATGVDTVGPTVDLIAPVDGAVVAVADFALEWAEPEPGATYEMRSSGDATIDPTSGELTTGARVVASSTTYGLSDVPSGTYYWQVRATDVRGNVGPWTSVRSLTVDLPNPGPTPTPTPTLTPTPTPTPTLTPTPTTSATPHPTPSMTSSPSPSPRPTPTPSSSVPPAPSSGGTGGDAASVDLSTFALDETANAAPAPTAPATPRATASLTPDASGEQTGADGSRAGPGDLGWLWLLVVVLVAGGTLGVLVVERSRRRAS